jgi:hypothetical protein
LKVSITENNRPALHYILTLLQIVPDAAYAEERGPVLFSVFNTVGVLVQQWRVQKETATWQQRFHFRRFLPATTYCRRKAKHFATPTVRKTINLGGLRTKLLYGDLKK